jgi:hypothetical protein
MEEQTIELLPEFEGSAAPPPEQVTVTLKLPADLLAWLKTSPLGWQQEMVNAASFVMDMSNPFQPPPLDDAWEPDFEETAGPGPQRRQNSARFRPLIPLAATT